jgi:hypothetical protein
LQEHQSSKNCLKPLKNFIMKNVFLLLIKKITFLLLGFLLLNNQTIMAQLDWHVGGNTLAASSRFGTNNGTSVIFETNNLARGILNSAGNFGIGTTGPVTKLHVFRNDGAFLLAKFQNSAGAGDRTALIDIQGIAGGANVLWRYGVGGTGNGLGISAGQFYIEKAGGGAKLAIEQDGSVGIGTVVPGAYKVKIVHSTFGLDLDHNGNDWEFYSSGTNPGSLSLYNNGNFRGSFSSTTGAYSSVSDEKLKTNIKDMPAVLTKVNQLKPATYQIKGTIANNPIGHAMQGNIPESYGFMAQDVMKIFPHLVTHDVDSERGEDVYSLDYSGFGVLAIKAIQELQKTMEQQQEEIKELKLKLNQLAGAVTEKTELNPKIKQLLISPNNISFDSWPNPAQNLTSIRYNLPTGFKNAQVTITDNNGVTLKRIQLSGTTGVINVNTVGLRNGTYNYSLIVDGGLISSKQLTVAR